MNIKWTLLILPLFATKLFSCAGCVDSPAAALAANTIISKFEISDQALASSFNKQVGLLQSTLENEIFLQQNYTDIVVMQIDSTVQLKDLNFLQNVNIHIKAVNDAN